MWLIYWTETEVFGEMNFSNLLSDNIFTRIVAVWLQEHRHPYVTLYLLNGLYSFSNKWLFFKIRWRWAIGGVLYKNEPFLLSVGWINYTVRGFLSELVIMPLFLAGKTLGRFVPENPWKPLKLAAHVGGWVQLNWEMEKSVLEVIR